MPPAEKPAASVYPAELAPLVESGRGPRLLDVRTPAEIGTAHIPGACNVPLDVLREHRHELLSHLDEDVVLVCQSGTRAAQAGRALAAAGLPDVRLLDGGMSAWAAAGLHVSRGRPRWDLERQVRLVAGALVLATVVASAAVPPLKWLGAGVGAGLTFAAVTNTCAMGRMLSRLPYNRGAASCDIRTVVAQLSGAGPERAA